MSELMRAGTALSIELAGKTILIVEDEFLVADEMARDFERYGAEVVGPVATLAAAQTIATRENHLDGAVLDINLLGETIFPLIDTLLQRGVRCVLSTGYDHGVVPSAYGHIPFCQTPIEPAEIAKALFGWSRNPATR